MIWPSGGREEWSQPASRLLFCPHRSAECPGVQELPAWVPVWLLLFLQCECPAQVHPPGCPWNLSPGSKVPRDSSEQRRGKGGAR